MTDGGVRDIPQTWHDQAPELYDWLERRFPGPPLEDRARSNSRRRLLVAGGLLVLVLFAVFLVARLEASDLTQRPSTAQRVSSAGLSVAAVVFALVFLVVLVRRVRSPVTRSASPRSSAPGGTSWRSPGSAQPSCAAVRLNC